MKQMKTIILTIAAILSLTACNKTKTCECITTSERTDNWNGQSIQVDKTELKQVSKVKDCKGYSSTSTETIDGTKAVTVSQTTCKIK